MTDIKPTTYRGRFAPSPTGEVHFGTLVAAVGSYLQAKKNNGKWLIRIEDVDVTRTVKNADRDILNTLEAFGFEWHDEVIYQSEHTHYYLEALHRLNAELLTFPCTCTRKQLTKTNADIYPGTCRDKPAPKHYDYAIRLMANDTEIIFCDAVMGQQSQNIKQQCGDFIIKRRDGLFAYQLAVVVDDALQGITEVVRGNDLLDSTPRQIYLQQLLHYPTPNYCHLPLAVDVTGKKISKSAGTANIDINIKEKTLCDVLRFLGQQPPAEIIESNIHDIWHWAIKHWQLNQIPQKRHITQIQNTKHV
ncbi:MAG: tRNA glutamyl-Q(34) synthetase GluQRS [Gammaproteobacteria bacterium]|nr:MAG: tRNA glutamyl-Q(34) synthetase GluQRS [Gammaproteobacteria bacterium]